MASRACAWLTALALAGCSDPIDPTADTVNDGDEPVEGPSFSVRYHTRFVDIAPGFSQPVCRGTLDEIDRHMERAAALLDIELSSRPTFFWFNEHAEGTDPTTGLCDWCSRCGGCYRGAGVIYSDQDAIMHELVHALVIPEWSGSDIVFSEGIAMGLDGSHRVFPPTERPSELAGGTKYGGAHFSRWLVDRFGPDQFRELFAPRLGASSTKEEVFAAVEEVYGVSFLELEAEYLATAASIYPALGLCDGLEHVPSDGNIWELRTTADCDAPHIFGPRDEDAAMVVSVTLDLPDLPGVLLTSEVDPPAIGHLTPCLDEPLYDLEDPSAVAHDLAVGNRLAFYSPGGRYRLRMPVPEEGEVHVRICPWNGEHGTAGEEDPDFCVDG